MSSGGRRDPRLALCALLWLGACDSNFDPDWVAPSNYYGMPDAGSVPLPPGFDGLDAGSDAGLDAAIVAAPDAQLEASVDPLFDASVALTRPYNCRAYGCGADAGPNCVPSCTVACAELYCAPDQPTCTAIGFCGVDCKLCNAVLR